MLKMFMVSYRGKADDFTYSRIGMMKNFIECVQTLKIFGWEKNFISRVNNERIKEISCLQKFYSIRGFLQVFNLGGALLSMLITIIAYVYSDNRLNLGECILVLNSIYTIQLCLPYVIMVAMSVIILTLQTFQKAQEILLLPEHDNRTMDNLDGGIAFIDKVYSKSFEESSSDDNQNTEDKHLIEEEDKSDSKYEIITHLSEFNFIINPGELVMIIGRIGSGKSILLQKLLGETDSFNSEITISRNSAYYSEHH